MKRMMPDGTLLLRVKMSKKERLKLRREYLEVKKMDQKTLSDKILETPVINTATKRLGGEIVDA
jgi:hypothetical protein